MKALRGSLFAGILWLLCMPYAFAHASSNSFLSLEAQGTDRADTAHAAPAVLRFAGRWDIALRDLDAVLALDGDGDGVLRWGEIRASASTIVAYASQALRIAPAASMSGTAPAACLLRWSPALQVESQDRKSVV